MDNTEEFRCISLCTGYAGLELGIKRVVPALRTVCYVEVEAFACANLVSKIEKGELDAAPIWTDIKTFNGRPFYKRIHIITAGYPCQPFSVAGKRKGTNDPRHLWPHIERIIETVQPIYGFFENVPGHLNLGYPEVYRSLRNLGYKVEAGLFTAEECGAPHKRERLFILAYNSNGKSYSADVAKPGEKTQLESCDDGRTSELADTECHRRRKICIEKDRFPAQQFLISKSKKRGAQWPSRPGQPQYEWEEPRVVDDTRSAEPKWLSSCQRQEGSEIRKTSKGQAQPRLGRAANGTRSRVDRLRLLGNGVVPQQAELAFRELIKLF